MLNIPILIILMSFNIIYDPGHIPISITVAQIDFIMVDHGSKLFTLGSNPGPHVPLALGSLNFFSSVTTSVFVIEFAESLGWWTHRMFHL